MNTEATMSPEEKAQNSSNAPEDEQWEDKVLSALDDDSDDKF